MEKGSLQSGNTFSKMLAVELNGFAVASSFYQKCA
jgi:hypothetical protein